MGRVGREDGTRHTHVGAVLRAYARLAPAPRADDLVVATGDDLVLFNGPIGTELLSPPPSNPDLYAPPVRMIGLDDGPGLGRLASVDALHRDERLLRLCWMFLVGTVHLDGEPRRIVQPLLLRPVRLVRRTGLGRVAASLSNGVGGPFQLEVVGDPYVNPLVTDRDLRERLQAHVQFGGGALATHHVDAKILARMPRLSGWVRDAADGAGLPRPRLVTPDQGVRVHMGEAGLVAIPRTGLVVLRDVDRPGVQAALFNWAGRQGIHRTAFNEVLGGQDPDGAEPRIGHAGEEEPVESPLPLTPEQRDVVRASRTEGLTVVSGAPGTGKTHTICAVALDAVSQGSSVLVATQSRYAAEVVAEQLDRHPGPDPIRFGDGVAMAHLIDELEDRMQHPGPAVELQEAATSVVRARAVVGSMTDEIEARLRLVADASGAARWADAIPVLAAAAPGVFDVSSDLDVIERLLGRATEPVESTGWFARRRRRRAVAELHRAAACDPATDPTEIRAAIDAARSQRAAARLGADGAEDLAPRWEALARAGDELRTALGRRAEVTQRSSPVDPAARSSVGQLVGALRAGRGRRRQLLGALAPGELTAAAPLWIGTLADIEDVLPAVAGLFDLVVLDEASQIEQPQAAPALLRARRAVVVGDPHQLRHVSFRSDADVEAALAAEHIRDMRPLLDLRRVSAYDLAAMAAPVRVVRDHFRSLPHLIDFSARRFYRDRLAVMTRTPATERLDAIDVVHLDDPSEQGAEDARTVGAEIEAVLALIADVASARTDGSDPVPAARTVGIITPFRAQADALERALVERVDTTTIDALSLRVGTVHQFQGGERDHVIVSTGLTDADGPRRRQFLEDPNLFNVMVTRGREHVTVVTGYTGTAGLLADYLAWGDAAPAPPDDAGTDDPWTLALAEELRRAEVPVRLGYPVGPWLLDLVVDDRTGTPTALVTTVGPDPAAHLERLVTLIDLGWRLVDASACRWDGDAVRAALDLTDRLRNDD